MLVTNTNRNVPIKVRIFANGVEQTTGSASLRVVTCGGDTALVVPLAWGSGRWNAHLDMSLLGAGCYVVIGDATVATTPGRSPSTFAAQTRGQEPAAATDAADRARTSRKK